MSANFRSKNFLRRKSQWLNVFVVIGHILLFSWEIWFSSNLRRKVTINVDKVLIRTALERLQKETKVHFVYDEENIDQDKRVSLSYTQAPLKIVLEDFCKQTSLRYEVKRNLILICRERLTGM